MKFKVWDTKEKKWDDEFDYFIGENGFLYVDKFEGIRLIIDNRFIPVYFIKENSKGEKIFQGDSVEVLDENCRKTCIVNVGENSTHIGVESRFLGKIIKNKFENPEFLT